MNKRFLLGKYLRQYGYKSVFFKNLIIIFLFLIIPFGAVCSFTYFNSKRALENEEKAVVQERLHKIVSVNDNFFQTMSRLSAAVLQKSEIRSMMNLDETQMPFSTDSEAVMAELNIVSMSHTYVNQLIVYSSLNDRVVTTSTSGKLSEMDNMQWLTQYLQDERSFYVESFDEWGRDYLLIVRKDTRADKTYPGYVFIIIDNNMFIKSWDIKSDATETHLIYDRTGGKQLFSSDSVSYAADDLSEFYKIESQFFELDYYYRTVRDYFHIEGWHNMRTSLILCAVIIVLCFLVTFVLSLKTFKPIESIMEVFPQKRQEEDLLYQDLDELSFISRNILRMINENEKLTNELEERMLLLNNAQIYALQYQINPHFIFNTLEAVKWLIVAIEPNDNNTASRTITQLSNIFQYSLNMSNYMETMEAEINNTKNYISVLQLRYTDKFRVEWQVAPEAYQHKIVKLSLQPLIENAVYHGLKNKKDGLITISISETAEGKLLLCVQDNGVGMSSEAVAALQATLDSDDVFAAVNVGLSNLNRRIKLMCGDEFGVNLSSAGGGFTVTVLLP